MEQPPDSSPSGPPLRRLFTPGERLGWRFRDRRWAMRPFGEPEPAPPRVSPELLHRQDRATGQLGRRLFAAVALWLAVTVGFACTGAAASLVNGGVATALYAAAGVAFLSGIAGVVLVFLHHQRVVQQVPRTWRREQGRQDRERAAWLQRRDEFTQAEQRRVADLPEWGAATPPPGTRRLDVVGGTLWGWEAFLTVFGTSVLGSGQPLTVLDLTGESVAAELAELTVDAGTPVNRQHLPSGLADSDLLVGLDQRQLVDALTEAIHADRPPELRDDRSVDSRILGALCEVIAPRLTLDRLAAALRTVMAEPGEEPSLTDPERERLAGLFSPEYRRTTSDRMHRLEAYLHPLRELGVRAPAPASVGPRTGSGSGAGLTYLGLDRDAGNVRTELLVELILQWVSRRLVTEDQPAGQPPAGQPPAGQQAAGRPAAGRTVVVAGADELPARALERLSDICDRRGIRLVLLFRHLRSGAVQLMGGGGVAFMRLGNHEEAARAADFIGREHRFVLTELTRTLGGSETHGTTDTEGYQESEGEPAGSALRDLRRDFVRPMDAVRRHASQRSGSQRGGSQRGGTRQWSTARSWAEQTRWTEAAAHRRVYEYTVAPATLQHLPDYAMLLVESRAGGPVVHPIECDPAILTLPRASHEPLPELPGAQPSGVQPSGAQSASAPLSGAASPPVVPDRPLR